MARRRKKRVEEPLTEELLEELLSSPDPDSFIRNHSLEERSLKDYLQTMLEKKGLRRIDVIHQAGLNETHGYQIFQGTRKASRDKLIALAFAMGLDQTETRRLLKAGGVNELYPKTRRDAIILFCLDHGCTLQKANEELYRLKEETIS